MSKPSILIALLPVLLAVSLGRGGSVEPGGSVERGGSAEPGDLDGDGSITVADGSCFVFAEPGSLDAFAALSCNDAATEERRAAITLEALRRMVPDPLPHWEPAHVESSWFDTFEETELETSTDVVVRLESIAAEGGEESEAVVVVNIENSVPILAFNLLLESEDSLLRPRWSEIPGWRFTDWLSLGWFSGAPHIGDIEVYTPPAAFLITSGRYSIQYGLKRCDYAPIDPANFQVRTKARLPIGTRAGSYAARLLASSQFLLEDGRVVSPTVIEGGRLDVTEDVRVGWDGGVPPLDLDPVEFRAKGTIELRLVDASGNAVVDGQPVASGQRGEEVAFRVQCRTSVPLNMLDVELRIPRMFDCAGKENLFVNPVDGKLYEAAWGVQCSNGVIRARFCAGGRRASSSRISVTHPERVLEYFRPLNEWTDLFGIDLRVTNHTASGDYRISFVDLDDAVGRAEFAPYSENWIANTCLEQQRDGDRSQRPYWRYDVRDQSGFIRVTDGTPIEPPPDLGVRFALDDVSGAPGELVRIPVLASASEDLGLLRLALEYDPNLVEIEALEVDIFRIATSEVETHIVARGGVGHVIDCEPNQQCTFGIPVATFFLDSTSPGSALIEWTPGSLDSGYPGSEPFEVATLLVRIAENPDSGLADIRAGTLTLDVTGEQVFTGARGPFAEDPMSPANEFRAARVRIDGVERSFLRGDSNGDGAVNLSDAVRSLGHLFLGATIACEDAADIDDDGVMNISDPILLLTRLFLEPGEIPEPNQACGFDPTEDALALCEAPCVGF